MANNQAHSPQLDALRALAVSGVLFSHFWGGDGGAGHLGVRLFFVLSGFLITGILIGIRADTHSRSEMGRSLRSFYIRRALRIWPAYFLLLGVALAVDIQDIRKTAIWHALFASNILFSLRNEYVPWVAAPWWSLSVEEQFYLVWPALMLLPPRRAMAWVAAAAITLGVGFHCFMSGQGHGGLAASFLPPAAFDALGAGALLAIAQSNRWPLAWLPWAGAAVLVAIILAPDQSPDWLTESLSVLPMTALVAAAKKGFRGVPGLILENPLVTSLGRISYGVYLYHSFVFAILISDKVGVRLIDHRGPSLFFSGSAITILVAIASWRLLEAPANRLKRLFPYKATAAKGPTSVVQFR